MTEQPVASGNDMADLMGAREVAYNLLAQLFLQGSDEQLLRELNRQGAFRTFLYAGETAAVQAAAGRVATALSELESAGGQGFQTLPADYTRLFIGPGRLLAPPWESAYLSSERLLFQESTLEVRRAYRKYGLVARNYPHEADDHLGFELEFMAHLVRRARAEFEATPEPGGSAVQQVLADQIEFLRAHLLNWIPAFASDVEAHATTDFYRALAALLKAFLEADAAFLDQMQDAGRHHFSRSVEV